MGHPDRSQGLAAPQRGSEQSVGTRGAGCTVHSPFGSRRALEALLPGGLVPEATAARAPELPCLRPVLLGTWERVWQDDAGCALAGAALHAGSHAPQEPCSSPGNGAGRPLVLPHSLDMLVGATAPVLADPTRAHVPQGWCPSHTVMLCPIPTGMVPCPSGFVTSHRWEAAHPVKPPSGVPVAWWGNSAVPKCHLHPSAQGASTWSCANGGGQRPSSEAMGRAAGAQATCCSSALSPRGGQHPLLCPPWPTAKPFGGPHPGHPLPPRCPSAGGTCGHPHRGAVPTRLSPQHQDRQSSGNAATSASSTAPWTLSCPPVRHPPPPKQPRSFQDLLPAK